MEKPLFGDRIEEAEMNCTFVGELILEADRRALQHINRKAWSMRFAPAAQENSSWPMDARLIVRWSSMLVVDNAIKYTPPAHIYHVETRKAGAGFTCGSAMTGRASPRSKASSVICSIAAAQ